MNVTALRKFHVIGAKKMRLITPTGFFSIVCKPGDMEAGTLTIRARVKSDLQAFYSLNEKSQLKAIKTLFETYEKEPAALARLARTVKPRAARPSRRTRPEELRFD